MDADAARRSLIAILQLAYSGELAAAYAYRGHWKSVAAPDERREIRKIEDEECHHRRQVGEMLAGLGAAPRRGREIKAWLIGRVLGVLCHLAGWFMPMYGAGKLESRNIREYEDAARHARDCGQHGLVDCLLTMAEVEWEHEHFFRSKVEGHAMTRLVRLWPAPPAKATIRQSYAAAA